MKRLLALLVTAGLVLVSVILVSCSSASNKPSAASEPKGSSRNVDISHPGDDSDIDPSATTKRSVVDSSTAIDIVEQYYNAWNSNDGQSLDHLLSNSQWRSSLTTFGSTYLKQLDKPTCFTGEADIVNNIEQGVPSDSIEAAKNVYNSRKSEADEIYLVKCKVQQQENKDSNGGWLYDQYFIVALIQGDWRIYFLTYGPH